MAYQKYICGPPYIYKNKMKLRSVKIKKRSKLLETKVKSRDRKNTDGDVVRNYIYFVDACISRQKEGNIRRNLSCDVKRFPPELSEIIDAKNFFINIRRTSPRRAEKPKNSIMLLMITLCVQEKYFE